MAIRTRFILLSIIALLISGYVFSASRIFYLDWLVSYGKKWDSPKEFNPLIWPHHSSNDERDDFTSTSKLMQPGCKHLGDVQWTLELDLSKTNNPVEAAITEYKQMQGLEQEMLKEAAEKGANHFHYGERSLHSFYCTGKSKHLYAYQGTAALFNCEKNPTVPVSCRDLRAHILTKLPKSHYQIYYDKITTYTGKATSPLPINDAKHISRQFKMAWVSILRMCEIQTGSVQNCRNEIPVSVVNRWIDLGEYCGPLGNTRPKMLMDYAGRCQ